MVDPGGPVTVVVPRPAVQSLAAGIAWHPAVLSGRLRPEVRDAVETAVATVPGVRSVNAEPGQRAEVAVVVGLERGLDRDSLSAVLARVNTALAASPLASQVDSVELRPLAVG
jgi:hypothetical protein